MVCLLDEGGHGSVRPVIQRAVFLAAMFLSLRGVQGGAVWGAPADPELRAAKVLRRQMGGDGRSWEDRVF